MRVFRPLKTRLLVSGLTVVALAAYATGDAGYEAAKRPSGSSNPTCPSGGDLVDSWGFIICNCTSYVAYRLRLNDVKHSGTLFHNTRWGVQWSDAHTWRTKVGQFNIREDQYPAVGSVAHWKRKVDGGIGPVGHVAYVQHLFTNKISGKLDAVGLMEYNANDDRKYQYRKIYPGRGVGDKGWPNSFLHFEEKGRDADATNVTCVTGLDKSTYKPSGANDGTFCWKHSSNTNASCSGASAHYYFDYRTCTKHTVSSSYCSGVTNSLPGYTAKIGSSGFPRPIDPAVEKTDFAFCDGSTSAAEGTSRLVSGRNPKERARFWEEVQPVLD